MLSGNKKQNLKRQIIDYDVILPSTRYQGSKAKIASWIWRNIQYLNFVTCLDLFGGTGVISYMLKQKGKEVHYNDYLKANYYIGKALIENNSKKLNIELAKNLAQPINNYMYTHFISQTFNNIYYTNAENLWLDIVVQNIEQLTDLYEKSIAFYALFQSCLVKRPFNLFHRKNLYLRFANVKRSFGNKATWDKAFFDHFINFVSEINGLVIDNGKKNKATNNDAFEVHGNYDAVYIDPPYTSARGVSVDYLKFYHFLEGLCGYQNWGNYIDKKFKHKCFKHRQNPWNDPNKVRKSFQKIFDMFRNSILIVSYRSEGIPSIGEIAYDMRQFKSKVKIHYQKYKYVLSVKKNDEVLIIGE